MKPISESVNTGQAYTSLQRGVDEMEAPGVGFQRGIASVLRMILYHRILCPGNCILEIIRQTPNRPGFEVLAA